MNIFFKDTLDSSDTLQLELLLKDKKGSFLDADGWWFAVQEKNLLCGCMAVYQTGADDFECVPFVHPDMRRKGIFSSILAAACKKGQIPGEGSVYFSCDAKNELWKKVLKHIGAEHAWDEHMMERKLSENEKITACFYCQITENAAESMINTNETTTADNAVWNAVGCRLDPHLPADLTASPILPEVTCCLSPQGQSVYLYSLEVLSELRNQHLGTAFLSVLLPQLAKKGFKTIKLQVSSENLPAMALYKKTGFRITQTLSFYEY